MADGYVLIVTGILGLVAIVALAIWDWKAEEKARRQESAAFYVIDRAIYDQAKAKMDARANARNRS